jgi:signal transduction histidine kinase
MLGQVSQSEDAKFQPDFFEVVFASLHGNIAVLNRSGQIVAVSAEWIAFCRSNGGALAAAGVGTDYLQVCDKAADQGDEEAAKSATGIRSVLSGEAPFFAMDYVCAERWYRMTVSPLLRRDGGAVVSHTDIGRLRSAELEVGRLLAELSHVERVTLLGQFAASLAHELNQPLTAILADAYTGRLSLNGPPDAALLRQIFSDVESNAHRAGGVISKLRGLLRKDAPLLIRVDLNRLIEETCELAKIHPGLIGVRMRLRLMPELPLVQADPVQIQQILLNLIHNAAESMQTLAVSERGLVVRTREAKDSAAVVVCVTDTGPGINPKDAERLFEAFASNKPDGMGMGLHVSRSIAISHGGRIWASPHRGRGARFCLSLPRM